ncbi:hypothetical protein [uncultured Hyphomicrobium sp.]|uniref:hypothetical protein n=1 Tax=uncultured Hyphomicrobium sp. TaxID=194373 RepID=UPI0025D97D47|nr:hypothetical protein [uncultured Hyphomicrobium sp.]
MTRTQRSARNKLRALIGTVLDKEHDLSDEAKRRIVNRILRQSDRVAEFGAALSEARGEPQTTAPAAPSAEVEPPPPIQVFDPYAIGAVVTLQRHGAHALMDRLSAIGNVEHLVTLASAQNLALKAGWSNADELCAAIVQCAEQRLAERRAAAS